MRLQINVDQHHDILIRPERFLIAVPDDADLGQVRAIIMLRLQKQQADISQISLRTSDGYQIDVNDADKVADLLPDDTDTVIIVGVQVAASSGLNLVSRLQASTPPDDVTLRSLIGLVVLPPSPDVADRALQHLCRSLNDDNIDRLGAFLVDETRRLHRLQFLLDIRPDLLRRLLTPALITAAVDAALDQYGARAPPVSLIVLCRAVGIEPSPPARETVRRLARRPELRQEMARLARGDLVALPPRNGPRPFTLQAIEAMDEAQFDSAIRGLMADPDQEQFRTFVKTSVETRFGLRMASDPDLVAVLYGLVRDQNKTWAARILGLLSRHYRTKTLAMAITDLNHQVQDAILHAHLT